MTNRAVSLLSSSVGVML
nr:TPA_asm: m84.5 sORF 1 [Murid betaherpesvirus 1]DBA07839.1 TPA_asm: m84.5 sORF 1 [Murid betaherpesvirus 1]